MEGGYNIKFNNAVEDDGVVEIDFDLKNVTNLETNNPYISKISKPEFDFTVVPEDYTFVDNRDRCSNFDLLPYSLREEVIEGRSSEFFKALARENERLAKQISLMNTCFKTTNQAFKHYIYCVRSNNWLKRHGLPMRRRVKNNG